jgi:hypothetical protein
MHVDKAKKLIAKQVKRGFRGFPQIMIEYFGENADCATEVAVKFTLEEGADVQEERFTSKFDARENEVIQSALVKIIQRANVSSVLRVEGVTKI